MSVKYRGEKEAIIYAYASAATAWIPVNVANVGVLIPAASYSAGVSGGYYKEGLFSAAVVSGVTVAIGDNLYYDSSANKVQITKPTAGFLIGKAITAGTGNAGGTVWVDFELNEYSSERGNFQGLEISTTGVILTGGAPVTITTAGAGTYTAANMKTGLILRDPTGAARTDTCATAAQLVASLDFPKVGSSFEFTVRNTADANEVITVAAGSGGTDSGTMTIAQNNSKRFRVVLTNVGSGTEAYTLYSLGTFTH